MKYITGIIFLIALVGASWFGYQKYNDLQQTLSVLNLELSQAQGEADMAGNLRNNINQLNDQLTEKTESEKIYTILVGGDIMMDRGVEAKIKKLGKDYNFSFDLIRDDLKNADYVFANLEGSISDVGADTGKAYSFRFEPKVAKALVDGNIGGVSIANNHMLDWGRESLCETTKHLDAVGIDYVGGGCNSEIAERPLIKEFGMTSVALLAYTEFYIGAHAVGDRPGMSEYDLSKIEERIEELKKEVDLIMVSMHWGAEYEDRATDAQVQLAKVIIDMGVDVIIGHHPHVDQEIEKYNNGWIIYSLGNFIFDQSWSKETMQGLLAEIQIQDGRVYDIIPKPIQLNSNYQPYVVK